MMYGTVLITGASGFIGSHLVRQQLALGRRVRALDLHRYKSWRGWGEIEERVGDISEQSVQEAAVEGVDAVFHLASAHLAVNVPEEIYWRVNVHCLPGFLDRCRMAGVKRFVHVSSVGVYGNVENPPADEDSPCQPDLLYERTKYEGEKRVKRFFEETGFPVVIVRPAWVYGPGCPRTAKLFRSIERRRFFFIGDGSALRHCVYVTDVIEAFNRCAEHPNAPGNVFLIADRRAVTIRDLIDQMATVAGVSVPGLHLPVSITSRLFGAVERAFTCFGKEPPVSQRSLKFFTNNTSFDISRLRNKLGFEPKVSLSEGLRLTYESIAKPMRLETGKAA